MPLKKAVETFNLREKRRRNLAVLRNAYGNALSDSNMCRMRGRPVTYVPRFCHNDLPYGKLANSYSWQLSNTYNATPRPKLIAASASNGSNGHTILSNEENLITRRYYALQRQARINLISQLTKQLSNKSSKQKQYVKFRVQKKIK